MKKLVEKNLPAFYFVLVFAIAWTIWIIAGVFAPQLFLGATLLGAWSPTFVALFIILLKNKKPGIKNFLKGLFKLKVNWSWYFVVLFSIPIIAFISLEIHYLFTGLAAAVSFPKNIPSNISPIAVIVIVFISGIFLGGPLAEDIGWRGFIVPELHKKMSALKAALFVGIVWVIWHLPFYWFKEGMAVIGYVPFPWFAAMTIAWAILFAWVYFNTKSLLMPVLYHSSINTTLGVFGLLNNSVQHPNSSLLLINTLLTWIFVAFVVWRYGAKNLCREKKVTTKKTEPKYVQRRMKQAF
jgi:membrane protease YdiL (CAAX protease family)